MSKTKEYVGPFPFMYFVLFACQACQNQLRVLRVRPYLTFSSVLHAALLSQVLLGRTSVPEDIGKLVSFLASEDSEYMTGQT